MYMIRALIVAAVVGALPAGAQQGGVTQAGTSRDSTKLDSAKATPTPRNPATLPSMRTPKKAIATAYMIMSRMVAVSAKKAQRRAQMASRDVGSSVKRRRAMLFTRTCP